MAKDGFEVFYSSRELEGCEGPLTFYFPSSDRAWELRETGDYIVAARLQPSGEQAETTIEVH